MDSFSLNFIVLLKHPREINSAKLKLLRAQRENFSPGGKQIFLSLCFIFFRLFVTTLNSNNHDLHINNHNTQPPQQPQTNPPPEAPLSSPAASSWAT